MPTNPESYDKTEKARIENKYQGLWAYATEALWRADVPSENSANKNPSLSKVGSTPPVTTKKGAQHLPTMLSLTHTQERVALEAHIHPRSGVSGGISHTCQWIATNNCIDTSELLVIGYGLPGSKLCHLRLIERNLNLQMIKFLDCVILKCFITITDNKGLEGAQQPHADARPWTVAAMPLSIPFSLIVIH